MKVWELRKLHQNPIFVAQSKGVPVGKLARGAKGNDFIARTRPTSPPKSRVYDDAWNEFNASEHFGCRQPRRHGRAATYLSAFYGSVLNGGLKLIWKSIPNHAFTAMRQFDRQGWPVA
jgi:hypothetical protein